MALQHNYHFSEKDGYGDLKNKHPERKGKSAVKHISGPTEKNDRREEEPARLEKRREPWNVFPVQMTSLYRGIEAPARIG